MAKFKSRIQMTENGTVKVDKEYNKRGNVKREIAYALPADGSQPFQMIFADVKGQKNKDGSYSLSDFQIKCYLLDAKLDNIVHVRRETHSDRKYLFFPDGCAFIYVDDISEEPLILPLNKKAYESNAHNIAHPEL